TLAYQLSEAVAANSLVKGASAWSVLESYAQAKALPDAAQQQLRAWNEETTKSVAKRKIDAEKVRALAQDVKADESVTADPYWKGRVIVAASLYTDPAEAIRDSVRQVMVRDPKYFSAAQKLHKPPKEASEEWKQQDA